MGDIDSNSTVTVALIPARGGSKRIPRKNIAEFCGKPMIAHSIECALSSKIFNRVIVSTDDPEVSQVALDWGAEVPFVRPAHLADDHATTMDVMRHAAEWLACDADAPDYICCLYATAPFVRPIDLAKALETLRENKAAQMCVSVTRYNFPIQRALRMSSDRTLEFFNPEYAQTRSQDLEEAWHDCGQFYFGSFNHWLTEQSIFGQYSVGFPIDSWRVQDIDTFEDWQRAKKLFHQISSV